MGIVQDKRVLPKAVY